MITLADTDSAHDELARFLNRQGPYAQMWIRLSSGEYVRYDAIISIAQPGAASLGVEPADELRDLGPRLVARPAA